MKIQSLRCPDCNASLTIEKDRDFCFCSYCGCQIHLDTGKQEKIVSVTKNISQTNRYINDAEVEKVRSEEKSEKRIALVVFVIFIIVALTIPLSFCSAKAESDAEEARLQALVDEVMEDIEDGDYDTAYIKANTIYYTVGWSSEIEKKWDNIRKSLLKKIEQNLD